MPWWGWIAVGALLLTAEMGVVDADFYLVFLGVSALLVGLVGLAGADLPVWGQWLLFAAVSVVTLVFFRRRVYGMLRRSARPLAENLVGEVAVARERIEPGAIGPAELRGTRWTARNDGPEPIEAGGRARVERAEGLTLHVRSDA